MKRLFIMFVFVALSELAVCGPTSGCSFQVNYGSYTHEFELWGNVRIVEPDSGADVQVYLAQPGEMVADLVIRWVDQEPRICGEWHKVGKDEDFTVSFVSDWHNADLIVMYGNPADIYCTTNPF